LNEAEAKLGQRFNSTMKIFLLASCYVIFSKVLFPF